jgi:Flp pilus assembly protein TadG
MLSRSAVNRAGAACLRRHACRWRPVVSGLRGLARRLAEPLRDRRGNAAIEFALVAPPFLLLIMGIIEISVMFFTSSVIEGATKEAARQIRTGNVQQSADPLASFRSELCDALFGIIDCNQVVFNVRTFSSFETVAMPLEVDEDGEIINTGFTPGDSSAVTVVRSMYRWHFMTPLIGELVPAGPAGHLIISTVAFQNEPYNVN